MTKLHNLELEDQPGYYFLSVDELSKKIAEKINSEQLHTLISDSNKISDHAYVIDTTLAKKVSEKNLITIYEKILNLAKLNYKKIIKIYLIVRSDLSSQIITATKIQRKLKKNFKIACSIIEVNPTQSIQIASHHVLKSIFVARPIKEKSIVYSPILYKEPIVKPKEKDKKILTKEKTKINFKLIKTIAVFLVIPWLVISIATIISTYSWKCVSSFTPANIYKTCSNIGYFSSTIASNLAKVMPLSKYLVQSQSVSPNAVLATIQSIKDIHDLNAQIKSKTAKEILEPNAAINTKELLTSLIEKIGNLELSLKEIYLNDSQSTAQIEKLAQDLNNLKNQTISKQSLFEIFKEASTAEKKTIALILQDSNEIKATGGYFEGLVILELDKKQGTSKKMYKTTDINFQILGNIIAPADYQYLSNNNTWNFSESNWDPDLKSSSEKITWYLQKRFNIKPDMFIYVTSKEFLRIAKELNLISEIDTEYISPNDDSGFIKEIEKFTENNLDAKYQKKLFEKLFESLLVSNTRMYEVSKQIASDFPWNESLYDLECTKEKSCSGGKVSIVDSNMGANKTGLNISKTVEKKVTFTDKRINTILNIVYRNNSQSSSWPNGNFINGLRIFLPLKSNIEIIKVGDQELSPKDYLLYQQHGTQVIATKYVVPHNSTVNVSVSYNESLPNIARFKYKSSYYNQLGITDTPTLTTVDYPKHWYASTSIIPSVASPGKLEYNTTSLSDQKIVIEFSPRQH